MTHCRRNTVPGDESREIGSAAALVSYGWGMVPVNARGGRTEWTTSLFPKNGGYVVPVKDRVRRAESLEAGDTVAVRFSVDV